MDVASRARERKLTQSSIARAIGVSRGAVHYWFHGRTRPSARHVRALARLLRCPVGSLLPPDGDRR